MKLEHVCVHGCAPVLIAVPYLKLPPMSLSYGCFKKWMYPTTMGFPNKMIILGMFWGYHHLRKHPYMFHKSCSNLAWLMATLMEPSILKQ